ncbi:hypothetical protein [Engelhardtia mirabilis]|uniref:hypothetical protein n=1 Tax=Engelhardtia mirabilis TaxID=2528011 RepID=UPI0011A7B839
MTETLRTRASRTAHWIRSSEGLAAAGVVLGLVAIELIGRRLPAEWSLVPAWVAFIALFRALQGPALGRLLRWPRSLTARLGIAGQRTLSRLRSASFQGGADLRGVPELPRAVPGLLIATAVAPWVVAASFLLASDLPQRFAADLHTRVFLLHALLVGGVWIAAAALTCGFAVLTLGTIHDGLYEPLRRRGSLRPEQEHALQGGLVLGWSALALFSPTPWMVLLGLCAAALALGLLSLPIGVDLQVAWNTAAEARLRTCSFLTALRLRTLGGIGCALAVVLAARGEPATLGTIAIPPLTFTGGMGALLAGWGAAAALAALSLTAQVTAARWSFSRARRAPVTLRAAMRPPQSGRLANRLRQVDFGLQWGRRRRRAGDVRVNLGEAQELALAPHPRERMTAGAGPDEPGHAPRRRSARLHRRSLLFGLRRAFSAARAQATPRVDGFWVGPWHWFERAVWSSGGEEEGTARCFDSDLGPTYATVLDWRSRAYMAQVCRRLEVDHIFVERGVSVDSLIRTVEMLFELDDLFGGSTRAEERHFRGIPGAQILIHEQPGEPRWLPRGFPDTDHDELARARILHLFRERGGQHERSSPRTPSRNVPLIGSGR